jgi:hypothetical protein
LPRPGKQFGLACTRAPVGRPGFLVLAWQPSPGVSLFGIDVFVDVTSIAASPLVVSSAQGEFIYAMPIPAMPVPTFHAQFAWIENPTSMTLSASDALRIQ